MEKSQSQQQDFLITDNSTPNYIVIPTEIWYNRGLGLSWQERVLLAEIDTYTRNGRECFMSNKHIAEFLEINETNASRVLSSLIEKGFVEKTRFDGRRRYITSTVKTCFTEQPSLAEKSKADLPNSATYYNKITSISLLDKEKEKNNARTREAIIADIKTENQLWIDNMMMHHKVESENEVLELAAWGYDQVALKGNEPTRGDIMKYCNAHVSDWREYKRREAIKVIPVNDRRMAFWQQTQQYVDIFTKNIRDDFVLFYTKASDKDPELMIFEQWANFDILGQLKQHKLRYEQRNQHTAL